MAEWILTNIVRPLFDGTIYICQHNICPPFCRCIKEIIESFQQNGGLANTTHTEVLDNIDNNGGQKNNGQINIGQSSSGGSANTTHTEALVNTDNKGGQKNTDQSGAHKNHGQSSSGGGTNTGQSSSSGTHTCYARELVIEHSDNTKNWEWIADPREPRFKDALKLKYVYWLEITAWMNFRDLTSNTNYAAYLVFRTEEASVNLDTIQNASISVDGVKVDDNNVCINPTVQRAHNNGPIGLPEKRDGWMELKLGQFYCDIARDLDVQITIKRTKEEEDEEEKIEGKKLEEKDRVKTGLIVAAIEVRPVKTA